MSQQGRSELDMNKEESGQCKAGSKNGHDNDVLIPTENPSPFSNIPLEANGPTPSRAERLLCFPGRPSNKVNSNWTMDDIKDKKTTTSKRRLMPKGKSVKESGSTISHSLSKSHSGNLRNLSCLKSCFPCCRMVRVNNKRKQPKKLNHNGMAQAGVNAVLGSPSKILDEVDSWVNFDVFELARVTNGHPLEALFLHLLGKFDLLNSLHLKEEKCRSYCKEIEKHYNHSNPYHNNTHAADVLQSVAVMLFTDQFYQKFESIEILSMLISATIHDVEHPGWTNKHHLIFQTDLAIKYNDRSVNENMHVSRAYEILLQDSDHMLTHLSTKDFKLLRKLIINTVLATDMDGHNALVGRFRETFPQGNGFCRSTDEEDKRDLLIQMIVHCADISNPARPWIRSRKWSDLITEEMHKQGDIERAKGHQPDKQFDKTESCKAEGQLFFLNTFVCPCFHIFGTVLPGFVEIAMDQATVNKSNWENELLLNSQTVLNGDESTSTSVNLSSSPS